MISAIEKISLPFSFLRFGRFSTISLFGNSRWRIIFRNYWSFCFEEIPVFCFSIVKRNENRPFDSLKFAFLGFEVIFFFYKK